MAAERFLRLPCWRAGIDEALAALGRAAGVSRVSVFQNERRGDGQLLFHCRHEWAAPGVTPRVDNPAMQSRPYDEDGWGEFRRAMERGECVCARTAEISGPARAELERQDIRSMALVPIFAGDAWWGFMGFDECAVDREWTSGELDALRAAAGILSAAIAREEADRRRRDTQAQYRSLVEQIPAIVYLAEFGPRGDWLYVSPQIERILGYTPEEWLAHPGPFGAFCHPEDRDRVWEEEARAQATGRPFRAEYRMRRKDGRWAWIVDESWAVRGEAGRPLFMQGIMSDATERRRAEEERRRLLARLVAAQDEERRRIAADIHDDQIQKMAAVTMRLRALRRHVDDEGLPRLRELERTVTDATLRLRHLLFDLRPLALDRSGLVAALQEHAARAQEASGIEHRVHDRLREEPVPEVRAALYRIAREALTNAVKHARASLVEVSLEPSGAGVLVRVQDDGRGFDPDPPWSPGHLGLVSMRERAELAGGWLRVRSAPGQGTTVECWLPTEPPATLATGP